MVKSLSILFTFLLFINLNAQSDSLAAITGMSITIEDDFTAWDLYSNDENPIGQIKLRWLYQTDWTEWDYRVGDVSGQIKMRTKNDPNIWELRSGNTILTCKTIYTGDFNQWRITDDTRTITYKTMYENVYDGWKTSSKLGDYEVYTQWEMDPRDWIIHDKLKDTVDQPFKVAMIFIASFYSSPKY